MHEKDDDRRIALPKIKKMTIHNILQQKRCPAVSHIDSFFAYLLFSRYVSKYLCTAKFDYGKIRVNEYIYYIIR